MHCYIRRGSLPLLIFGFIIGQVQAGPIEYTVVDLGAQVRLLHLVTHVDPPLVVGKLGDQGVLVQQGQPARLSGVLPGGFSSELFGGDGTVAVGVGSTGPGALQTHALLLDLTSNTLTDLGTLNSDPTLTSTAAAVNGTEIVGACEQALGEPVPCLWLRAGGGPQTRPTLGGVRGSITAINQTGTKVGQSMLAGFGIHATLWPADGSAPVDLTPEALVHSNALGLSDSGEVVGELDSGAFRWTPTDGLEELGIIPGQDATVLTAVNSAGVAVGFMALPPGICCARALRHQYDRFVDLNTLIPTGDWLLEIAVGISETGRIVGTGTLNGEPHAFLLVPTDTPRRHQRRYRRE